MVKSYGFFHTFFLTSFWTLENPSQSTIKLRTSCWCLITVGRLEGQTTFFKKNSSSSLSSALTQRKLRCSIKCHPSSMILDWKPQKVHIAALSYSNYPKFEFYYKNRDVYSNAKNRRKKLVSRLKWRGGETGIGDVQNLLETGSSVPKKSSIFV